MTIRDSAIAKLQQLPEPLLQEVSDFIDFITQKHLAKTAESQGNEKLVDWQQKGYGIWAIEENNSHKMIGYCGLRYLDALDEVEVLYGLAKAYWGRGIAFN